MNEIIEFFFIGYAGEKNARRKPIDISDLQTRWPDATPILMVNRPKETAPYPATTTVEGSVLYWEVAEIDVAKSGFGQAQVFMRDADGNVLGKSAVMNTLVKTSLNGTEQENPPPALETWIAKFLEAYEGLGGGNNSGGSSVSIDITLTQPGKAADAKATGDALSQLNEQITAQKEAIDEQLDSMKEEIADQVEAENVSEDGDLFITDSQGNVLAKFADGHVQTKHFYSSDAMVTTNTDADDGVFDITDPSGNVVVRFKDGYIYTQKVDTTNPYELPSYYHEGGYLDAKCGRIRELMAQTGGDAFFFCTDQHVSTNKGAGNARQSHKLMHYIAEKCRVNKLFLGGDMDDGINEKAADEFRKALNGRSYACAGNHEYMSSVTEEQLAYALSSGLDDEVSGDPLRRYFYVDNPKHKVRYIVTNGFMKNGEGSWEWGLEQTQLDWLNNTALNVESGWTIVVFTHMVYGVVSETDSTLQISARHQAFLDLLDAYTGNGTIAAVICGHTHLDAIRATNSGIPVLITGCDKWFPYNGMEAWLHGRVPGTITEQCFDVCVVDTVNRKIYAVRIGGFATDNDAEDAALMETGERTVSY